MIKSVFLALALLATVALSVTLEENWTDELQSTSRMGTCQCKCLTKKGSKRRALEVCGRTKFIKAGCIVEKCRNSKNVKGFHCCDGPEVPTPTPMLVSPCPCKCKGGPRAFKKARKQCKKLAGLCTVSRCSKNKFKRWQCCDA